MSAACPIWVVLGKRLNSDALTVEGKSRVDGLLSALQCHENSSALIVFCGGVTAGQTVSEAQRMHEYFQQQVQQKGLVLQHVDVLLELQSTSTVENIEHLAHVLLASQRLHAGETLSLTLVSSDYHLKRIFEIQDLMDEQGLLHTLDERCLQAGVKLDIPRDLNAHVCVPYPYSCEQGMRFLWVDELTTYRVFLEGVVAGTFQRPLPDVYYQPYHIAKTALTQLRQLMHQDSVMLSMLALIEAIVESSAYLKDEEKVREELAILDTQLTLLNRLCDPELERTGRWWKR
ncbi:YdcF family protein [Vibrio mimicus]|uniref:YdcF family protein n=1 Tax=Vibrio mimicus TaxID=674 RepID=UPI00076B2EEB|nr:YdcF family protein [Vibrio mimicus]AMG02605.1 YdcF family protein [Vibrio mimicus]KAA3493429.1 YdcF family protein [Vibrio mimicus]